MKERVNVFGWIMAVLTAVYALVMLYLLFFLGIRYGYSGSFADYAGQHIKLVPLETVTNYVRRLAEGTMNPDIAISNLFGNIVLFVPLGVILPYYIPAVRKWYKTAALTAAVILAVETLQLLTMRGTFDIDDIILNTLGALIGYVLFAAARMLVTIKE